MKWTYCLIIDEVLRSRLSTAAVVNTFVFKFGGHTVSVSLKCSQTAFAISDDNRSTLSDEIDTPSECSLSIRFLLRVFIWSITPMWTSNGVSWLLTSRVHSSVLRVCFTLLNLRSWANFNAAWLGFPVDWHLVFGPSFWQIKHFNQSIVWCYCMISTSSRQPIIFCSPIKPACFSMYDKNNILWLQRSSRIPQIQSENQEKVEKKRVLINSKLGPVII